MSEDVTATNESFQLNKNIFLADFFDNNECENLYVDLVFNEFEKFKHLFIICRS